MERKYFRCLLERKDREKNIHCNVLYLLYKDIKVVSLYIDDIDKSIVNMKPATRKKWAWKNYSYLIEEMGVHLI